MKQWLMKMTMEMLESMLGPKKIAEMAKQLRHAVLGYLEELAKRTENEIDDKIVEVIKRAFEVEDDEYEQ